MKTWNELRIAMKAGMFRGLTTRENSIFKTGFKNGYRLSKEFILTRCIGSRLHDSCRARSIILNLMRECYELSLPHIGRIFDRDHTTVLHHIDLKRYKKRYWQGHFTIWQEFEEFKKQLLEKP
jgi:hypothetical protein